MKLLAYGGRLLSYLKRNGAKSTFYSVCERIGGSGKIKYQYKLPVEKELRAQEESDQQDGPSFSIVVPAFRTPEGFLREMVESVLAQTYGKFQLLIGDATEDESVEQVVRKLAQEEGTRTGETRIRYLRLSGNLGISENTNRILREATGSYIGLLDHDDTLTPDALYEMASLIRKEREAGRVPQLLYSDEDKWDGANQYYEPHFKPDFNLDLLLSNNYICHFLVMKRELMQELLLRKEYDGAQDYDLVLRAAARILERKERILHVSRVLYHWRCYPGSTSENPESKKYAYEAGRRALQDFADRMGWKARAVHKKHLGFYGLDYQPHILAVRKDVGALGGRLVRRGGDLQKRIVSGAMDEDGRVYYKGLPEGFSGYMHRASLIQDVEAVDLRCFCLAESCFSIFQEVTGVPYVEAPREHRFDETLLPEGTDIVQLSIKLGKALREAGFLVCWDPGWVRRL